jgi:phage gp29-like protein
MINHCNSEISKTLLSETLTTEIDSGSFAAAQTHFRVRKEVVISDSKIVENSINKLISYAVKINFNINKFPKFQFVINDSDNLTKIERDIKLVQSGVKFTKDYWMKTYGLSDSDFII